jgi:Zn-dependent metalloprotease
MRRSLGLLFLLQACSAPFDDPSLALLRADDAPPWQVRWDTRLGVVASLVGRSPPLIRTPDDAPGAARAFLARAAPLYGIGSVTDELAPPKTLVDRGGGVHVRFEQQLGGVPVDGGELRVHFDGKGAIVAVTGRFVPPGEPSTSPVYDAGVAAQAALAGLPSADGVHAFKPTAVIWAALPRQGRLAWRCDVEILEQPIAQRVFVDAVTGAVLERRDPIRHLVGSGRGWFGDTKPLAIAAASDGKFVLTDDARALRTYSADNKLHTPGSAVTSSQPDRWDDGGLAPGVAVDVHAALMASWDHFAGKLGWRGLSGDGQPVRAVAHLGIGVDDALFDGRQLLFGDGDGADFSPLGAAADIVAHEYAHGVLGNIGSFGDAGESRVVEEGLADLFAVFTTAGSGQGSPWQIGETVYHPGGIGAPLRDLVEPHRTGGAAHLSEWVDADGSPAIAENSTIVSHAGWWMAQSFTLDDTEAILWGAARHYLTPRSGLADFAEAAELAAVAAGLDSGAVRSAWLAVGLGG